MYGTQISLFLLMPWHLMAPGPRFNIKMSSYQYRKSHCGDKTVVRSSYLPNGISYTGKISSLYWIRALATSRHNASDKITSDFKFLWISLTYWGRMTHICIRKLTIIGSDIGLSPGRCQVIIWTNAGILLIRTSGTNFSEISSEIHPFSFKKGHLKISSVKWWEFSRCLNVLMFCKIFLAGWWTLDMANEILENHAAFKY